MIEVDNLFEHFDNPRKDLGDLSELADSIKESGILQNLTVVKRIGTITNEWTKGTYTVIIGHRRLAAAKMAGLTEVPCAIAEMDEKTQIATMLLENMQRSDLSVYEQAQGFQMMIDLGESVSNISDKTGFSETTVRRRTKLLDLDQEKLKESNERGGTLSDYIKLEQIESEELKNEVLESVGTNNFNWKLNSAIQKEETEKTLEKAKEVLSSFAIEIDKHTDTENMAHGRSYNTWNYSDIEKPEDANEVQYYFIIRRNWLELWKDRDESEEQENQEEIEAREREKHRKAQIKEIEERAFKLREVFIYSLTNSKVKPFIGDIVLLAIETRVSFFMWPDDYIKAFKLEVDEENFDIEEVKSEVLEDPELSLLKIIYSEEFKRASYFNFRGEYSEDSSLDMLYDILEKLGYQMSEEEKQLKEGTHNLFMEG